MREPVPGPSRSGSVILDLGPGVGALVLHAAPEMGGREIEVSPLGGGTPAHRTHSRVRPRKTGGETQYAARVSAARRRRLHDMGRRRHPGRHRNHRRRPGDHYMLAWYSHQPPAASRWSTPCGPDRLRVRR